MVLAHRFWNVASTHATASALAEAFGEPSIVPISHSFHKFHISWLCIVGAIKHGVVGTPTSEYFHAYVRLPIYPSLLWRDLHKRSGRRVS